MPRGPATRKRPMFRENPPMRSEPRSQSTIRTRVKLGHEAACSPRTSAKRRAEGPVSSQCRDRNLLAKGCRRLSRHRHTGPSSNKAKPLSVHGVSLRFHIRTTRINGALHARRSAFAANQFPRQINPRTPKRRFAAMTRAKSHFSRDR